MVPPATLDPALRQPILPGRPRARAFRFQPGCRQERHRLCVEFRSRSKIAVLIAARRGKCLPQLLHNPLGSVVQRHIAVQNLPTFVLDDKKAIQHRRVTSGDGLAMILQKGQPLPLRVPAVQDARRYRATVRSAIEKPSFCSSPWILGADFPRLGARSSPAVPA